MIVVANAGPLIALAQLGCLDLLPRLYRQVRIPPAVRDELFAGGQDRAGAVEVGGADWIQVVEIRDSTAVGILRERLDAGESEALVLAIECNADLLLIDEARGRRVAEARGLNKTGTIGTLILGKRQGHILSVSSLLDQLRARGFHMSEELYQSARALAGEAD